MHLFQPKYSRCKQNCYQELNDGCMKIFGNQNEQPRPPALDGGLIHRPQNPEVKVNV